MCASAGAVVPLKDQASVVVMFDFVASVVALNLRLETELSLN